MFSRIALFSCLLLTIVSFYSSAQPYVDPFQLRFTYGFRNSSAQATPFTHLWAGSDLPIKLRDRTYQLLSPFYESWHIDSSGKKDVVPNVQSLAFPIGFILPTRSKNWTVNILPVMRWNGEKIFAEKTFQIGGAAFATWTRRPQQNFRFGLYVNREFFGLFVMPLVGADWKISERDYVFGLLPGRLTWEHKIKERIYYGATFRAITNSFRLQNGSYQRIDDNQISMYADLYPAKRICITLESGYGIMRRIRIGQEKRTYLSEVNFGDGPFVKLSASYRIRF